MDVIVVASDSAAREMLVSRAKTLWPSVTDAFSDAQRGRLTTLASGLTPVLKVNGATVTTQWLRNRLGLARRFRASGSEPGERRLGALLLNGVCLVQLLRRAGFSVELINDLGSEPARAEQLLAAGPKVVVLSTSFFYHRLMVEETAKRLRSLGCEAPIVAGGPFITRCLRYLYWVACLSEEDRRQRRGLNNEAGAYYFFPGSPRRTRVDWFVLEQHDYGSFLSLVRALKAGDGTEGIGGVARSGPGGWDIREGKSGLGMASRLEHESIDWSEMGAELQRYGSDCVSLRITVGCSHRCRYCDFAVFGGRRHRKRSLDELEAELRSLVASGVRPSRLFVVDDNLALPTERSLNTALLLQRVLRGRIPIECMSDLAFISNRKSFEAWRDAGLDKVLFGVESGNNGILCNMGKTRTSDRKQHDAHRIISAGGVSLHSYILVGFPGETEETVEDSIRFLNSYPAAAKGAKLTFSVSTLTVFPLTPLDSREWRERFGLRGIGIHWGHETMSHSKAQWFSAHIYLSVARAMYAYSKSEGPDLSLGLHQVRQKLCRLDFIEPGAAVKFRPEVVNLWQQLEHEVRLCGDDSRTR